MISFLIILALCLNVTKPLSDPSPWSGIGRLVVALVAAAAIRSIAEEESNW